MDKRICKKCGVEKPMTDFPVRSGKLSHLRNHTCRPCWSLRMKQWRADNPEKEKLAREKWKSNNPKRLQYLNRKNGLERKYGMTVDEWDALFASQKGQCKICGIEGQRLVVDHCHSSGKVRMLLCDKCNRGLGCFNDDPRLMIKAAEVIRAFMEAVD